VDECKPLPHGQTVSGAEEQLLPVTEVTLKLVGSFTADVYDSPLSQCLRAKSALLAPSLAAGRAADAAAAVETADRAAAYNARVAAFIRAARAAGVGAESGGAGVEAPRYAPAMRVSAGDMRVTLVVGGGPASASGAGKHSEAVVSAAEAAARAADAPWQGGCWEQAFNRR